MKNYSYLVILVWIFLFLSCEQDGEDIYSGYMKLTSTFVYPETTDPNAYTVTYNGKDIKEAYFSRNELTGQLQVFAKDTETPELDIEITVEPNENIQLIKLPGKDIELYREEDFMKFSATMSLFEGYKAVFNDQEILDGENYIKKVNATGDLEFYGENEAVPVYTIEDMTIEAEQNIIILQSSETEFVSLEGGTDDEEAPVTENLSKVNFFYSPAGALNVNSIRMEIYSYDYWLMAGNIFPVTTIVLEKGKLSPYIELDIAQYQESYGTIAYFVYGLYNAETGELIEDVWNGNNSFTLNASGEQNDFKTKYKFVTYQVTNAIGYPPKFIMGEEW
ncbi:MAG: hypothetical protein AB2L24_23660 [Mangrovibacterium sp.]